MKIITFKNNTYDGKKSNYEYISEITKGVSNSKVELINLRTKDVENGPNASICYTYFTFKVLLMDLPKVESLLDRKVIELGIYHWGGKSQYYVAQAIKEKDKYYYCIDNTIIEISNKEYELVIGNPFLYYFSTALKLHTSIQSILKEKLLSGKLGLKDILVLSDFGIDALKTERPGHPGQFGFMFNPTKFKSNKEFIEVVYTLMMRLIQIKYT